MRFDGGLIFDGRPYWIEVVPIAIMGGGSELILSNLFEKPAEVIYELKRCVVKINRNNNYNHKDIVNVVADFARDNAETIFKGRVKIIEITDTEAYVEAYVKKNKEVIE